MSFPAIYTNPCVGISSPAKRLNKVDLPDPEAPTIAKLSADLIVSVTDDKIDKSPSEVGTIFPKFSVSIIFLRVSDMSKFVLSLVFLLFSTTLAAKSIVILGDSISASYGIHINKGWVSLLQEKIDKENQPFTLYNESISGDTTAGGLARIVKTLIRHKPKWVLLELGANDGLKGLSLKKMKSNLVKIVERAEKAGAQVLLLGMRIPPNYGKRYVDRFYNIYPEVAKELNIPFVPFILEEVALAKGMMQKDGLHPSEKAQPFIADKIWKYLKPVLNKS
jgi:acyl-CoA thioesterase-1